MEPLYNKELEHVGWLQPGRYIYDTQGNCIAYISNNNIFSIKKDCWLGPIRGFTCFDHLGKPVAWNHREFPMGIPKPVQPKKVIKRKPIDKTFIPNAPKAPEKPLRPIGGWSKMTWEAWLKQWIL